MKRITEFIRCDKEFSASVKLLSENLRSDVSNPIVVNGLSDGASSAYLAEAVCEAREHSGAPVLILCGSDGECETTLRTLREAGLRAEHFKSRDFVFYNISASHDTERERLSVLYDIAKGSLDAVVTTPSAAMQRTVPKELLLSLSAKLSVGCELEIGELSEKLVALGFRPAEAVDGAGQFSHRGGIVDLWARADMNPVRIEFFGNEIDRMVFFDPISQRAKESAPSLDLMPAAEVVMDKEARTRVKKTVENLISAAKDNETRSKLSGELSALSGGLSLECRDKYIGIIYEKEETLLSYIEKKCAVFILGTNEVNAEYEKAERSLLAEVSELISAGLLPRASSFIAPKEKLSEFLSRSATIHINSFSGGVGFGKLSGIFGFRTRRAVSYGDNVRMLFEDIESYKKSSYRIFIFSPTRQGADSLVSSLLEAGFSTSVAYDIKDIPENAPEGSVTVSVGDLVGYELIGAKLAVFSMAKDEGRRVMLNRRRQRILRKAGGAGQRIMSYADLSVGDYVVHANYGIGLFEGMQTVRIDGVSRDYITIRYAGTDKLFVPCDSLENIGKYIGDRDSEGKVKLSKMGGADWHRTKTRAKSAARDIARDLIRIYAERMKRAGFAFPKDSELEDEFAASFPYEETESQLLAIEEIKADMMRPTPMNRLLCGDVGFGKTEVALRAAFKAIMGGKQVAILVPTTILALQHYETAHQRMREYPVTVDMLSRLRTPKEQAEILRRTERGETDILIGTHKLLSKKIKFRDLGLLIVDEEQRFGVAQKEKLKELATNIDVLTLSATPIPRTLNMAMNGISDMSVLDEAPGERRPVQTYVLEHDDAIIVDAIKRELTRSGQVLYLYNKVSDIAFVAARIEKAIPEARVAIAHGQMEHDELEDIWRLLVSGEIDVLVCTTIIETGVDLPNANTLIIENADRMGLSQLHQIRGRVGRSRRQAYAYLTYRPGKVISEIASKRLKAIREFAEFGAGFKVALCDLEIRGAGNLLGAEQHGYIDSVGYDLYVKLLNEAVLEERGESAERKSESSVNIKVDAFIPEYYVASSAQRMEMYKKISLIETEEDMADVTDELCDRFGNLPRPTEKLIEIAFLRALAEKTDIKSVDIAGGEIVFRTERPCLEAFGELFVKYRGLAFRRSGQTPGVAYKLRPGEDGLRLAKEILLDYGAIISEINTAAAAAKGTDKDV